MNNAKTIAQFYRNIQLKPDDPEAYKSLGNALQALGKLNEAKRAYSIAVEIQPDFAAAYANIGNIFYQQGELDRAVEYYERAIAVSRRQEGEEERGSQDKGEGKRQSGQGNALSLPGIYSNLGNVRHEQGLLEEAVACWQEALALDANFGPRLYWKVGNLLLDLGRLNEAIACYQKQISLCEKENQPDELKNQLAKLYSNLGTARLYDGELEEAIASFNRALEIQPDLVELYSNLGLATGRLAARSDEPLLAIDLFEEAVSYFVRSLQVNPNIVEAHRGLFALIQTFQPSNWDLSSVRRAADQYYSLCAEPAKIVAATAVAIAHLKSGNAEVAKKSLQEIEPQFSQKHWNQWNQDLIDLLYSSVLFCLNRLRDDLGRNSQVSWAIGLQFSKYLSNKYPENYPAEHLDSGSQTQPGNQVNLINQNEPLKIGFISGHFWRHSVGWCSADIISELSKLNPNIYLYQTEKIQPDDKTEYFKQVAAQFNQVFLLNPKNNTREIIKKIESDRLDILIDLDSLTIPCHADILHYQPAPLCISWLGFDAPFISDQNYFLTDWHSHPSGVEKYYREHLLRMPDSFVAVSGFESQRVDPAIQRQAMRIDLEQVVYLCVAPATKLNPELVLAQIKIIKQVFNSILLYKGVGDRQVIQSVYQAACEAEGVSFHRVKFLPRNRTEEEHRTIYQIADILLDSYPYNGGTHNLEALWFHLPIVTRFGEQFLSRMGYSFLKNLGISQGLASGWQEYVAWGIKLGQDANLRNRIRQQLQTAKTPEHLSPLWNPQKFAQDMYKVLKEL